MKTFALLLLLVGCSRPEPPTIVYVPVEPSYGRCELLGTCGMDQTLANVDARRDGQHEQAPAPQEEQPEPTQDRVGTPAAFSGDRRFQEPIPHEPPQSHATESNGTWVVEHGNSFEPMNRYELDALIKKCRDRPTRWAREQCMAGK